MLAFKPKKTNGALIGNKSHFNVAKQPCQLAGCAGAAHLETSPLKVVSLRGDGALLFALRRRGNLLNDCKTTLFVLTSEPQMGVHRMPRSRQRRALPNGHAERGEAPLAMRMHAIPKVHQMGAHRAAKRSDDISNWSEA